MAQKSLIYSFVARGTVILAEHSDFTGNFTNIAFQCLQRLPASNNRFTYTCDGHTFNYLLNDGFTYCVVAVEAAGRQVPMACLERIKENFDRTYGGGKASVAVAKSLNKEFGPKMKGHMQYCVDHPEESSKLMQVKAQVSDVKAVMIENIDKILERGTKIEDLVDKTENLRSQICAGEICKLNSYRKPLYATSHGHCMEDVHYVSRSYVVKAFVKSHQLQLPFLFASESRSRDDVVLHLEMLFARLKNSRQMGTK
ncbi:vesicle-associated membrane protein 721-like isoform X1 [Cucumis melo]|uniref:Vesicle-associated membrane protein 721-like isoform X1 n=1 Tax=Cucumis melo TaxID=3656 RepID=A0ABM3KSY3_CUCME|nr:vesicle-associated membrane protein 721-like isoform X1 [Cucumis melo]